MNFELTVLVKDFKNIFLILLVSISIFSCGGKKRTAEGIKLKNHNWKVLVDSLKINEFDYDWIRSKATANVVFREDKNTVKANIRVRRDSASWVNLSKGIQILTALASNDSIKILKKLGQKEYYIDDFKTVNRFLNTTVDYSLLEDFFAGNAIGFDFESTKYKSGIDDGLYILSSDKIKKMDKILKKGHNKNREILYRCWINPNNFKCQKVKIDLLLDSTSLIVEYGDWKLVGDNKQEEFPFSSSIVLEAPNDTVQLTMKYSKVSINTPQTMPFKLTDSYIPMVIK